MATLLAMLIAVGQVAGAFVCACCPAVPIATPAECCPAASGCPHCPKPRPAKPCPPNCCSAAPAPAILTPEAVDLELHAAQADPLAPGWHPLPTIPLALDLSPWDAAANDLPFLTTAERLYAHHALRC